MARNWTEKQLDAITAVGGSVLVSAAAGSGKTAVLVERVIRLLTDEKNPTSADRLLIVTFTRAAAAEMRQRISDAIEELLSHDPGNENLISQQMLLPSAKICTIDSFCLDLVKENFQLLDISSDFKIADEGEIEILSRQAMDMTLEKMYQQDSTGEFKNLVELLIQGRDDSKLSEMIHSLYVSSMSFPFPERWLDSLIEPYESEVPLNESTFGKVILSHVKAALEYAVSVFDEILEKSESDEVLDKIYTMAVTSDKNQCLSVLEWIDKGDWNEARQALLNYSPMRKGSKPRGMEEDFTMRSFSENRDRMKDTIRKLPELMCCSEEEFKEDMLFFLPMIKTLIESTKMYMGFFNEHKKEKKIADFSDIAHMALSLLVKETDEGWESTPFAKNYSDAFDEILIDEYQDTNAAQDMLFASISRNNLFRVGDVKQSIYRFRQADPEIFISLKDSYEMYRREKDNYPAKIILGNNFRSRKGVTNIINFIFSQIMSRKCGDVNYDSEESLVCSAQYSEKTEPCAELHILDTHGLDKYEDSSDEAQARYIAALIKDMIKSGYTVKDGDGERPVSYGDFAVLLRATGGGRGICYADVFRENMIPTYVEIPGKFLESTEVSLMLNILRVIDNPKQDIPLLSVLMSAVFGFSVDEVSDIRLKGNGSGIYSRLVSLCDKGYEKIDSFLSVIQQYRTLSVCLSVSELIDEIYLQTGLMSVFDAVDPTGTKRSNLMLLSDYGSVYESMGYGSLSGFIRFMDNLSDKKKDISGTAGVSAQTDVVKIMTIHKSKGLEFPVCIIGGCGSKFNTSDEVQNLIISQKHGIGVIRRDIDTFEQYSTVCHKAVQLSVRKDNISEELRVLYVALTRAREKLIMVYAKDNAKDICGKYASKIPAGESFIDPYDVSCASGFGEWLITTLLRHPDAENLREEIGVGPEIVLPSDVGLKVVLSEIDEKAHNDNQSETAPESDMEFLENVKKRIAFRYKYEVLSGITTKRAASEVDRNSVDRDYFALSAPSFLLEGSLSGTQRGIATHTFMQYADYSKAAENPEAEIERLKNMGILTPQQAEGINRNQVAEFFTSTLAKRILSSDTVMREKKFTIEIPISEMYEGFEQFSDELMMIQGIADCAFLENGELIVVDYKTDRLDSKELFREKYSAQVLLYKKALALCTGYNVKQTLLYSFHLGREIEVD